MLATLSIRDVVLIDRLDLEFGRGLITLTGETGAGKSILLDALGLSLGGRGESRLVRHGAGQAVVSATFELGDDHPARSILKELGLQGGEDGLTLRRTLSADSGRSRAFVNDQAVSLAVLRRLGETLVEIHGQFDNQRLMDAGVHREVLDSFGGLMLQVRDCSEAWQRWRKLHDARIAAEAELATARRDEELLRHALDELDALDPQAGEEAELAGRRALLQNAEKLTEAINDAHRELSSGGGRGMEATLMAILRSLQRIADKAEGRLEPIINALDRAASEVAEASALLERAVNDWQLDPRQLEGVEGRLFALRALSRKHGRPVDELAALRNEIADQLARLDRGGDDLERLRVEEDQAREAFTAAARALSKARQAEALRLDAALALELEPLRLGKAKFHTGVETLPESEWGRLGADHVEFQVATNPGSPPGPLAKIASGGELSRLMLALKVVLARADPVSTLVFDEVDAGVGGAVAAAVGERLAQLAADVQVLVVTHSPQVAAHGDRHWRISKAVNDGTTRTRVEALDDVERREEIARMLAGATVTEEARAAAASLLAGLTP